MAQNINRVQVMLSDETYEKLKDVARNDRRTVSEWLRLLIEDTLTENTLAQQQANSLYVPLADR